MQVDASSNLLKLPNDINKIKIFRPRLTVCLRNNKNLNKTVRFCPITVPLPFLASVTYSPSPFLTVTSRTLGNGQERLGTIGNASQKWQWDGNGTKS